MLGRSLSSVWRARFRLLPGGLLGVLACSGASAETGGLGAEAGTQAPPVDGGLDASSAIPDGSLPRDGASVDGASTSCLAPPPLWTDPGATPLVPDPALAGQIHHFDKITLVDQTAAPVVGATLTTTNHAVYTSDQNGNVAYYEPGLMGTSVWFEPASAGYTYPADGLGNAGIALAVTEGGSHTITMTKSGAVTPPSVGDLQTRLLARPVPGPGDCFAIRVVDGVTARGIPLVELTPASATEAGEGPLWSDSQGVIAYCDPDFVGKSVTFSVTSDGYALPAGAEVTLSTAPGGRQTVSLVRENPGERLYRVTGQGIYRDSVLLGLATPVAHPNVNGLVMGQDTPSTFVFGGKLWWLWQDTDKVSYALGNFDTSGAVSLLPDAGGLSPDLGSNQVYFVDSSGFSRGMVNTTADPKAATGQALGVWLGGIVEVVDPQGVTQAYGTYYVNTTNPWVALAMLDPATSTFDYVADYPAGVTGGTGRATLVKDVAGVTYAYWNNAVRFPATVAGVTSFSGYEVFSAYGANGSATLRTNPDGSLAYAWTAGATPVTPALLKTANVDASQALDGHLRDIATGAGIGVANQAAMWNEYRKRYSDIVQQEYGSSSFLGEIWYTEGDTPFGPWVFARKVVTHDGYTFYNPDVIPYFSEAGGRILFFDATYTNSYTKLPPTPRYNYNEIMYRLDLDDPRMLLPVAIYDRAGGSVQDLVSKRGVRPGDAALEALFFAYDRPVAGSVPVSWSTAACGERRLEVGGQAPTTPVFYAFPAPSGDAGGAGDAGPGTAATVPLYEYIGAGGAYLYSVDPALVRTGFKRGAAIASVWPSPVGVALPVADFLGDLVADAGPDQCVQAASADGTASVTLDASRSRDLAGSITEYRWSLASTGCTIASGVTANVALPAGVNDLRLDTTDAAGNLSSDGVVVWVSP